MAVALRIARLHTHLQRPADRAEDGLEISWLQELGQRSLPAALAGVAERALSQAGLPPEAVVAVRRLNLRLKLADGASDAALLQAWSQALEQALVLALSRARQASAGPDWGTDPLESSTLSNDTETSEQVVVFADAWAAEAAHLGGLLRTGRPAWWAERLLDGRGEPLDLAPAAILLRWLERHPARAVAAMAQLANLPPRAQGVSALLRQAAALELANGLAERLSKRPAAELALPAVGSPLRALLEAELERLRLHPQLGATTSAAPAPSRPWRLALLLQVQPSLALLSPATLLAVVDALGAETLQLHLEQGSDPSPPRRPGDPVAEGSVGDPAQKGPTDVHGINGIPKGNPELHGKPVAPASPRAPQDTRVDPLPAPSAEEPTAPPTLDCAWIHAGGLLLLLNRPVLFSGELGDQPEPAPAGDLALLALQRLLAPLAIGERAAALQRERPLLSLLAPDRPWPERLDQAVVLDPEAAEHQLTALIAAIPEAIGFAPGALRQVYGPRYGATPPLPDRESHKLAALLWRPGLLEWDGWEISLSWPLASVDGALRRGGWDLDPGWQPAQRRVVRFHYRAEVLPPLEEQP
jgi:hypothetical protein